MRMKDLAIEKPRQDSHVIVNFTYPSGIVAIYQCRYIAGDTFQLYNRRYIHARDYQCRWMYEKDYLELTEGEGK